MKNRENVNGIKYSIGSFLILLGLKVAITKD